MQSFLHSVLTARIILTIRDVGNRPGLQPELHTSYFEISTSPGPLQFASRDEYSHEQTTLALSSRNTQDRDCEDNSSITSRRDRNIIEVGDSAGPAWGLAQKDSDIYDTYV
jgi:hypothetical protein